ncbi:hypothetical protein [Clostridium akagii]|uniref:hypothetical protein n=1 Tax=Clostridium akagii TaxID=91623 RepID=UPI0012EBC1E2|nr:hypothetical protein [Clostridium akagii]
MAVFTFVDAFSFIEKEKSQGKIRKNGFSFHDTAWMDVQRTLQYQNTLHYMMQRNCY